MRNDQVQIERVLPHQAARILGTSATWVRILVDTGRLPAERGTMGIRLIDRIAVEEFAERRRARKPSTTTSGLS